MVGQKGHCLGKVFAGISAEDRMFYDHRDNENNTNKSVADAI